MLVTGVVASRIGAKRTLLAGLALIVVFSALAGASDSIGAIVGFRAGWGLGNALFIATALSVIIGVGQRRRRRRDRCSTRPRSASASPSARCSAACSAAISWRGPFFGVAVLMAVAFVATAVLLERTPEAGAERAHLGARPAARAAPPRRPRQRR